MAVALGSGAEDGHANDAVLDDLDDLEEAVEMTYALSAVSAVRASAKRETLAARLASEHDVKRSIQIPVTVVEELMAQAGGGNAAPAAEAPVVAEGDGAV